MNIEFLLIHSMKHLFVCKQICFDTPVFEKSEITGVCFHITYLITN